jgi:selenocysteine lyase/cysteine desulfurase
MNCQRSLFSLPDDVHYLNCAYMSPLMKTVEEAGIEGIHLKARPYLLMPPDFFHPVERFRTAFAKLVHVPDANAVVPIPSVSYGMSIVERNIHRVAKLQKALRQSAGCVNAKTVVVVEGEFPSVVYSCKRICEQHGMKLVTVTAPTDEELHGNSRGQRWNERLLEAIDEQTTLVALSAVHWADGTLFDLQALRARTRDVGALLVLDGTQCIGALPFDVEQTQPDALICSAYKWMLGPYSIGAAYWGDFFLHGEPNEEAWLNRKGSENFSRLVDYQHEYQPGMMRYAMGGQSNFILLPMASTAMEQLNSWTVPAVYTYISSLTEQLTQGVRELGCTVEEAAWRSHHLVGVRLPFGVQPEEVQRTLVQQKVYVSVRGSFVRVSPHVYNTPSDVEALLHALRAALQARSKESC